MRKQIIEEHPAPVTPLLGGLDLVSLATVLVSSERPDNPAENAFDGRNGPGGSRWIAEHVGEQTFCLAFDEPQNLKSLQLEIEEIQESRTQEIQLAVSLDNGTTFQELLRQEFNFSPPGTTYEREKWNLNVEGVTHVRLRIKPDKGGQHGKASITSLVLS